MKQAFKDVWAARKTIMPAVLIALLVSVLVHAKQPPMAVQVARVQAVVRMVTADGRTYCSAVVVGRSIALTAAHCVDDAVDVRIMLQSGEVIDAKVVKVDQRMDRAVIIGSFDSIRRAAKAVTEPAKVTAAMTSHKRRLVACGYPHGARLYCSPFKPAGKETFYFKGVATGIPGMSGGPVMDADTGEVFAVNSYISEAGELCVAPLHEALAGIWETSSAEISSKP